MPVYAVLLMLCLQAHAHAAELTVQIRPGVPGKLTLPAGQQTPQRAVLLLHGWNAPMDEVGDLYKDLALRLSELGIASLRFSFSGEGERVGYLVTSTLDSRIGESKAAFELLKNKVPDAVYGVVGFSLGGLTAMAVVGQQPNWFQSMVLWSAAQEMRMGDAEYDAAVSQALNTGRGVYQSFTEITLTREFVLSYTGVYTSKHLATYPGALLTIRGDQDFLPMHDPAWLQLAPTKDKAFMLIGGADHIFNVLDEPRPNMSERVIKATADWFDWTLR